MTAYTNIPNALVQVGAKPFATTIQALRDNPIAIAEGAAGAPRVNGKARTISTIATGSVTTPIGALQFTNLPPMREIWLDGSGFRRDGTSGNLALDVSANNGSSWQTLSAALASLLQSGDGAGFSVFIRSSTVFTQYFGQVGTLFVEDGITSIGAINAIRLRHSGGGNLTAGSATVIMDIGALE